MVQNLTPGFKPLEFKVKPEFKSLAQNVVTKYSEIFRFIKARIFYFFYMDLLT